MNFFKGFLMFLILITLIVTCSNVQSLRDEYVSKPNNIEKSVSNMIDRLLPEEE